MNVSTDWKMLSQEKLVDNKFYQLWDDAVEAPNGKIMHWYVRRNSDFSIIIPFEDDSVYMVEQYRYPVDSLSWEFPMGKVVGKTPHEMAQIELHEETGIRAQEFIQIAQYWVGPGGSDAKATVFIARGLSLGEAKPEEFEAFAMKKLPVQEVEKMILDGKILDSHTIIAYHYLENYLNK